MNKSSNAQLCYPGSNVSCIRAQYSVGVQVGLYVVFWFNITVNILGNSVVILSISHFRQLHSPTNLLLLSLAVVDLLMGVIILPFSMTRTVQGCWFYGDSFCLFHSSTDTFLCTLSIFHLVCIAVDRYEAVCNPLRYTTNITMNVACFMVVTCWVVAALLSYGVLYSKANVAGQEEYFESLYCLGDCLLYLNPVWTAVYMMIFFFIPCTVIVGLYTKIYLVAKEHKRKIEDSNQCANARESRSKPSEHKAAKKLGIVVGVYIICWLPFCLNSIIDSFTYLATPVSLFQIFYWLPYFNSTMNPIIYALSYPWFRKCFKLIVKLKIFEHDSSDIHLFI